MIKKWIIIAEVNMDASKEVKIIVEANTLRKAAIKADKELDKYYFHHNIRLIREINDNEVL